MRALPGACVAALARAFERARFPKEFDFLWWTAKAARYRLEMKDIGCTCDRAIIAPIAVGELALALRDKYGLRSRKLSGE